MPIWIFKDTSEILEILLHSNYTIPNNERKNESRMRNDSDLPSLMWHNFNFHMKIQHCILKINTRVIIFDTIISRERERVGILLLFDTFALDVPPRSACMHFSLLLL